MFSSLNHLTRNINMLRFKSYSKIVLLGSVLGLVVIQPFTLLIFWLQFHRVLGEDMTHWVLDNLDNTISRKGILQADLAYMLFGILLTFIIVQVTKRMADRNRKVEALQKQLAANLPDLISMGETDSVEFKSSLRWDYNQNKMNKKLEFVILKSIAGFLNGHGGNLLIGVQDDGKILGLKNDYQTLKKKNRDGFALMLTDLVVSRMGGDLGHLVTVIFHEVDGKDICRVVCQQAARPVYCKDQNQTIFYLRSGCSTRALDIQEAISYIKNRWPT